MFLVLLPNLDWKMEIVSHPAWSSMLLEHVVRAEWGGVTLWGLEIIQSTDVVAARNTMISPIIAPQSNDPTVLNENVV